MVRWQLSTGVPFIIFLLFYAGFQEWDDELSLMFNPSRVGIDFGPIPRVAPVATDVKPLRGYKSRIEVEVKVRESR